MTAKRTITRREVLRGTALVAGAAGFAPRLAFAGAAMPGGFVNLRCEFLREPLGLQQLHPRLSWSFSEEAAGKAQSAYQLICTDETNGALLWDSGRVTSAEVCTTYAGGPLHAFQRAAWKVRTWDAHGASSAWSATERWSMGPLTESDWAGAQWIGRDVLMEATEVKMADFGKPLPAPTFFPAPYLRKEFQTHGRVIAASLSLCGLGFADVHLNGQRIDTAPSTPRERDPGYTDFNRSVLYVTHDVTQQIKAGVNALGAILGTGWFDVHDVATWHYNTATWRSRPKMRAVLSIRYADGSSEAIVSDASWRTSSGPIVRDGIYTGEVYDARKEIPDWDMPGFDSSTWKQALIVEAPRGTLKPLMCEPVRILRTLAPSRIDQPKPGVYLVDFGQNIAGHAQLRVTADSGTTITLRYGEALGDDGMLDTHRIDHFMMQTNPRQPFQQDSYICKGGGMEEVWEQRFSYSGFRYIEVTGFPGTLTNANITGRAAWTAMEPAGSFECSDATVNKIQEATLWSYRSNAQNIPTDCPHREKNGWTGDSGLAGACGLLNFHSIAFYIKWLEDFREAQRADGGFPVIIPNGGAMNGEGWPGALVPPWDAAYPMLIWEVYRECGDRRVLASHIEPLRRYLDYFLSHREASGLVPGLGLGDWLPFETKAPLDFVSNAYLLYSLDVLLRIARALFQEDAFKEYAAQRETLYAVFQREYFKPDTATYADGCQTAQSLALAFGFVPPQHHVAVAEALIRGVEARGHLDVGILGARYLFRMLSAAGRTDLALRIAIQPTMPSYGYWIAQGGTTLWEDWHGTSSSKNHIMFGDISAWFYEWIAGIQMVPDAVAWDRIVLRPNPVAPLTWARAHHETPRGRLAIEWHLEGKLMHLDITIPSGATAALELPVGARLSSSSIDPTSLGSGRHHLTAMLLTAMLR